jgi:hypothetical protein
MVTLRVFVGIEMKEKLEQVLKLLRGGYVDAAYDLIEEIIKAYKK